MQKHSYRILLSVILSLLSWQINAQGITEINILPSPITNQDTVKLETEVWFEYSPCKLDSVQVFYACGAVAVNAFYSTYFDPDTCISINTIDLGRFPNGFYALTFNMYNPGYTMVDSYQSSFTVETITGTAQNSNSNDFLISPNPSDGSFYLNQTGKGSYLLQIYNLSGAMVFTKNGYGRTTEFIETRLKKGCYIYRLQFADDLKTGKIMITE